MIGQNLAANLELATACGKRIILRILAKVLQIDVAMIVARLARDMVDALFLEFPQGAPSHLRHSFHLELPEIVLGDRDKKLKGFDIGVHHSRVGDRVETLLLQGPGTEDLRGPASIKE